MVGEAHLVGVANVFNVKYIINECGLPTICRLPPGRYLLGRYTYTGLQHFLGGQVQLLYAMCVEKRKRSNKYTYLTILLPPSQTALPINHQRVHCKALPFVVLHHPVQMPTACSCEGIGVGDAAQWYANVAALVFPRPPHAAAWVFSGTEAPG